MFESLQLKRSDPSLEVLCQQILYCSVVLFLRCLHGYASAIDPNLSGGNSHQSPLVLVDSFDFVDVKVDEPMDHRVKKLKSEVEQVRIQLPPNVSLSSDVVQNFTIAYKCWIILRSPLMEKEFGKLCDLWFTNSRWPWVDIFKVDALLYQGLYKEAAFQLDSMLQMSTASGSDVKNFNYNQTGLNLQLACCFYQLSSYPVVFDLILKIIGGDSRGTISPTSRQPPVAPTRGNLQLLLLCDEEIFSYCIHLLIACLKKKAWKNGPTNDMVLGHMMVLMQFDWPHYESLFCDVLNIIKRQNRFVYNLFFTYIVNIDMLEEFAYLRTPEGGKVNLDILSPAAKSAAQAKTVTRGVNKGAKEDLKVALEKQVSRSEESIDKLLRLFLIDEKELLQKNLE